MSSMFPTVSASEYGRFLKPPTAIFGEQMLTAQHDHRAVTAVRLSNRTDLIRYPRPGSSEADAHLARRPGIAVGGISGRLFMPAMDHFDAYLAGTGHDWENMGATDSELIFDALFFQHPGNLTPSMKSFLRHTVPPFCILHSPFVSIMNTCQHASSVSGSASVSLFLFLALPVRNELHKLIDLLSCTLF